MSELDERIAAVYGVSVDTSPWLSRGARAERQLLAADEIARLIGDRSPRRLPEPAPVWPRFPPPTTPAPSPAERAARIHALRAWAEGRGVVLDALALVVDDAGACSARAARAIAPGEEVAVIPRAAMIVHDALSDSATGAVDPFGPAIENGATTLAVWLAREQHRRDSPWRPYLDALPTAFPDLPWYRADDTEALAGTEAILAIAAAGRRVLDLRALLRDELRDGIPLVEYGWATAVVASRGYRLTIGGADRYALVPISDLLDHRPGDTRWIFDDARDAMVYTALRAFAPGEPVHASYGSLASARLVQNYGFALEDNPDDLAALVFAPAGVRIELSSHLLWDTPLGGPTILSIGTRADARFHRALSLARLRAAGVGELLEAVGSGALVRSVLGWMGVEVERAALAELAGAVDAGRARLAAPPGADEAWRDDPGRTPWQRACAVVRRGERAILDEVDGFVAGAAELLRAPAPDALLAAADAIDEDAVGRRRLLRGYLRAVAAALTG